jgi:hypothetical protein
MDPYVNFQGLKHNFEKVWRCFCKINRAGEFSLITELFFYQKSHRIGPRSHGLGPWSRLMIPRQSGSLSIVDSLICDSNFIKMKGYWQSNLGCWSRHGWLRRGRRGGGGAPQPWRWFTGAERSSRYGAPFSMRFNPTDAAHPEELT